MGKVLFLCKIILVIILLVIGIFSIISIFKCIYSNFDKFVISFFRNMTLSDEEHQTIDEKIKKQYKESSLYKVVNSQEILKNKNGKITENCERLNLLSEVRDFYKEEIKIFSNDYSEFLKKIEFLFKMFSLPIPVYAGAISYVLEKRTNSEFEYGILLFATIIYLYYFVRVVWIQSLKNGFSKLPVEYPFLIKNITLKKYIESYIVNSAVYLKIQRENLLRLKMKILYIHVQYVLSSAFLILVVIYLYITK